MEHSCRSEMQCAVNPMFERPSSEMDVIGYVALPRTTMYSGQNNYLTVEHNTVTYKKYKIQKQYELVSPLLKIDCNLITRKYRTLLCELPHMQDSDYAYTVVEL